MELHNTVAQSEECMILTHADIATRIVARTALTNQDITGHTGLSAKNFHTQTFAFGFTTIAGTTDTFFMSHFILRF